jgi:hypothetical protein
MLELRCWGCKNINPNPVRSMRAGGIGGVHGGRRRWPLLQASRFLFLLERAHSLAQDTETQVFGRKQESMMT